MSPCSSGRGVGAYAVLVVMETVGVREYVCV